MPSSVYVETSVISYLTARQSQDVIVAARQAITRNWWQETRHRFDVYLSMLVIDEAGAGDAGAAAQRAQVMAGLPILELTDAAQALAGQLIGQGLVPKTSVEDSLHIALATVHGMDFLLTWNFRHINNAEMKAPHRRRHRGGGIRMPGHMLPRGAWRRRIMKPDPIVEAVRKVREAHAAKFDYDLAAICADLRGREKDANHPLVRRPPKLRLKKTGS